MRLIMSKNKPSSMKWHIEDVKMIKLRDEISACLLIIAGIGLSPATEAAGTSVAQAPQVNTVSDWRPVPAQDE